MKIFFGQGTGGQKIAAPLAQKSDRGTHFVENLRENRVYGCVKRPITSPNNESDARWDHWRVDDVAETGQCT